jgi:hypothetical protein
MDARQDAYCVVNRADAIDKNVLRAWPCARADYAATSVPDEPRQQIARISDRGRKANALNAPSGKSLEASENCE